MRCPKLEQALARTAAHRLEAVLKTAAMGWESTAMRLAFLRHPTDFAARIGLNAMNGLRALGPTNFFAKSLFMRGAKSRWTAAPCAPVSA
jgi:hypothetical protein